MEDGILYLAARYYAAAADEIRKDYEPRISFAAMHPDCDDCPGFDSAECDLMLDYLRVEFPYEVVDVVDGVDKVFREWEEEDLLSLWEDYFGPL